MQRQGGIVWDRLTVVCVLSFCLLVAGLSVGIVLGELREQLHLSGLVAAAHGSTFGVGLLIAGVWGLRLVTRFGRPAVFRGACAFIVIGVMLLCVGQIWPVMLAGTAIASGACATLVLLMPGIVADHHGPDDRAGAFAAISGLPGIAGITFSLVIGAVLAAGGSWRWPFALLTLAIAVSTLIVGRGVEIPEGAPTDIGAIDLVRGPDVRAPFVDVVHAALVEFPVGVWAVVFLKEVGGASSGAAASLGAAWGLCILVSRMMLPRIVGIAGPWSRTACFGAAAIGATMLWTGPGLAVRVLGLMIAGFGCGPLYPLSVDALYRRSDADSVALGAVCALASGIAITVGPLALGVLADVVTLHHAILWVPVLAAVGAVRAMPSKQRQREEPLSFDDLLEVPNL
ncbi:MAG: MFS transporter [Ilumatobacteraceae bacterium]